MVKSHSSVGIVLYHADEDALIVVRQFRPAVSCADMRSCWRTFCFVCTPANDCCMAPVE